MSINDFQSETQAKRNNNDAFSGGALTSVLGRLIGLGGD